MWLISMALLLATRFLVNSLAFTNGTLYDDAVELMDVPEIVQFSFSPNPVVEGQSVNVTCIVRPPNSQVMIIRIRGDDLDHKQEYQSTFPNDTISIYGAANKGILWGNVPFNKSGSYFCEGRNSKGLVRSRSLNLYLRFLPEATLTVDMTKVTGIAKRSYVVHPAYCEVVSEKSASEYHWAYIPLSSNHSWTLLPHTTPSINVSAEEAGTYQCSGRLDIGWSRWSAPVLITPSATAALMSSSKQLQRNSWAITTIFFVTSTMLHPTA